jgi:hypothetical protein
MEIDLYFLGQIFYDEKRSIRQMDYMSIWERQGIL